MKTPTTAAFLLCGAVLVVSMLPMTAANATQIVPGDVLWTATHSDEFGASSQFGMLHGSTISVLHDYASELPNVAGSVNVSPGSVIYVGELYGTATYDLSGTRTGSVAGLGSMMVWDLAGNVYMNSQSPVVRKTDAAFHTLATFTVSPFVVEGMDLARDQCTLYFTTSHPAIGRYDVCQDTALAPIPAAVAENYGPIRGASDNSVFVAGDTAVFHFSPSGALLGQYQPFGPLPYNLGAIAFGIDPNTLWISLGNSFRLVDTISGALLRSVDGTAPGNGRMAVVGEPRAALAPDAIPLFSPWIAALFAAALIAVAIARS